MQVVKSHRSSFESTPVAKKGERVRFLEIDAKDDAWFKGKDSSGTEGYFPVAWFVLDRPAKCATALRDYDAFELTVEEGATCEVLEQVGSWCRVHCDGKTGWIPRESVGV